MKKIHSKKIAIALFTILVCVIAQFPQSCRKDDLTVINSPMDKPVLPPVAYSYFDGRNDLATLGRVLFYDKKLSLNDQISCGSCHKQKFAFADNARFSQGLFNGYTGRNSIAIISNWNRFSGQANRFWDGRAANTDTAVFMPVMNSVEMHIFNLDILPDKLSVLDYYPDLFLNAFGTTQITIPEIQSALSCFINEFVCDSSKFDRNELTSDEMAGKEIFENEGRCYGCHNGSDFNGYAPIFEDIGLDVNYADIGRGRITGNMADNGKFLVPTLRNLAYTAPYMHDGRYNTLREVIDHYDHGIQNSANLSYFFRDFSSVPEDSLSFIFSNQDFAGLPVIQMHLTELQKTQLEKFLLALSDPYFIADPKFSDPFLQ